MINVKIIFNSICKYETSIVDPMKPGRTTTKVNTWPLTYNWQWYWPRRWGGRQSSTGWFCPDWGRWPLPWRPDTCLLWWYRWDRPHTPPQYNKSWTGSCLQTPWKKNPSQSPTYSKFYSIQSMSLTEQCYNQE